MVRLLSVASAAVLVVAVATPVLGRFTDPPVATAALSTDTLDVPAGLTMGPSLVTANLSWTAVADAYAQGYLIYRSTTSGSGFALIKSVTPRTTTSTTDTPPLAGRYYYVIRAFAGSWLSGPSNEVSILFL